MGFLTFPECGIVDHYKKGRCGFLNSQFCDGWEVSGGGQGCITFAGSRWLPSQVPQPTSGYPAPTFTLHSPLQSDICPYTLLSLLISKVGLLFGSFSPTRNLITVEKSQTKKWHLEGAEYFQYSNIAYSKGSVDVIKLLIG